MAAPVSWFHHARWDSDESFCTFNELMVTALTLQTERPGLLIGILDHDYGNGTDDILDTLGSGHRECHHRRALEAPGAGRRLPRQHRA